MVSDMYPPAVGGMEKEIQLLSEGLTTTKNCEVIVCTIRQGSLPPFEETNHVKVYRLEGSFQRIPFLFTNPERKFYPPIEDRVITRKMEKILLEEKPDVVHTHNWMLYSVLPLRRKMDFSLFVTFHDFGFICPRRWSSKHEDGICDKPLTIGCIKCGKSVYGTAKSFFAYIGLLANQDFSCDALIFSNPNLGERLPDFGPKIYLGHPIDTEKYRPIRTPVYQDRILIWTKLDKMKGVELIFQVAERLSNYRFDVAFIGDDKAYYKKISPPNVNFIPKIESSKIPYVINSYPMILGQFHVGVFGHAELEAMSCSKPVISYWKRKYDSFYDEPCPILSSKNVEEIVDLAESHIQDEELGNVNRRWILKNHAVSIAVEKLHGIYAKTIGYSD